MHSFQTHYSNTFFASFQNMFTGKFCFFCSKGNMFCSYEIDQKIGQGSYGDVWSTKCVVAMDGSTILIPSNFYIDEYVVKNGEIMTDACPRRLVRESNLFSRAHDITLNANISYELISTPLSPTIQYRLILPKIPGETLHNFAISKVEHGQYDSKIKYEMTIAAFKALHHLQRKKI